MSVRIVSIDTETTGLDPTVDEVWEIAAVVIEPGDLHDVDGVYDGNEFVWTLSPSDRALQAMSDEAAEVNRYFERTGADDWEWNDRSAVLHRLSDVLDGAVVVGSNPDFDLRFLTATYRDADTALPWWQYRPVDVVTLAAGWLAQEREALSEFGDLALAEHVERAELLDDVLQQPWRSIDMSRAVGVPTPSADMRHTALGDARWCADLYRVLTGAGGAS